VTTEFVPKMVSNARDVKYVFRSVKDVGSQTVN